MQNLQNLRKGVEKIDKKIMSLVAARFITTNKIQLLKSKNDIPLAQKKRESELLKKYSKTARKLNLAPAFVQKLFSLVFSYSKKPDIMK